MKIKKIMSCVIAVAAAVSCMTLSAGVSAESADAVSDEEATKIVVGLKEGDCYWVYCDRATGEIAQFNRLGSVAIVDQPEEMNIQYKFIVLADGTVAVSNTWGVRVFLTTMYDEEGKEVNANFVFPETAYGRTVTAIKHAFIAETNEPYPTFARLQTVTIPATITSIDDGVLPDVTTIYGESGSYAETYAKERGVTFTALSAPAEQTTTSAEQTAAPAEQTTTSAEQTAAPAEQTTTAAEQTAAPAEQITTSVEQTAAPAEEQTTSAAEQTAAPEASDNTQQPASDKGNADTGAEGVAVVAAVALIAAGSVIVCRKRK